jgi:quercetin dioxygenase-like cupin family protein
VKIVRVLAGADGESHFEDLNAEQLAEVVSRAADGPITVSRREADHALDYHNAPRRQWVVFTAGVIELETADGSVQRMSPGDVLVAEDITGHGHIIRGVGTEDRVSISMPLPPAV